ncbi:MAG: Ig-like domain-containing protein, partial [Pirellulales bacterium]|nr:Ig-like domain-containing protein [Pirellulales bacterium]
MPAENTGERFPDVNGSDSVTALDALQVINRLGGTGPILAARLVNDSAPGGARNLDFLTNEYELEFGLSFGDGSERLELKIDGQPEDPFTTVNGTLSQDALLRLEFQLAEEAFELSITGELEDAAGNLASDPTVSFSVADPAGVTEFRPSPGEQLVRTTREIRVNLDEPIDPDSVGPDNFFVTAGGRTISGRTQVGSDARSITLFPDQPLPPNTRGRLVVNGDQIIGVDGLPLDAN